jgi:cobalt-zinc-cadmium efflux system outer membrane protein
LFNFYHPVKFAFACRAKSIVFGFAFLATSAVAQTVSQPPSLRQAVDAAWQASHQSRSLDNRRKELAAKEKAAGSWLSGEPVAGIAHRTDWLNRNEGFREYEAEIELPLWNPRVRTAAQADVSAQRLGFDAQFALARLKLTGELRALAASAAMAQVELDLNKRKLLDANVLMQDLNRRVKAGENARVDGLQAQLLVQQAQTALAHAESQLTRLQNQWRSLTGLAMVASLNEPLASSAANEATAASVSPDHPALRQAQAQVSIAQAKLALTAADQRDPMALGLGIARERGSFGVTNETKLRIALRIPLGGDNRNEARDAAARAELDTAQAELDALQRQLPTEVAAATADLRAARFAQTAATERVRLSTEVQILITKSWRLGDGDLPARLRAENEQFEASLSLARAAIDVQRAIANLNQAHGVFP